MRWIPIAAIAATLGGVTPAAAADVATLGCVDEGLIAPARTEIADFSRGLVDGGHPRVSAETRQAVHAAATACATRFGWSDAALVAAQKHVLASVSLETLRPIARKSDLDLEVFAAVIALLTEPERAAVLHGEAAGKDALLAGYAKVGTSIRNPAQAAVLGVLAFATVTEENQRAAFAAA